MIPAGTLFAGSYDPLVVALSFVIAVAASYAALDLAGRVTASKGWSFAAWLTCGSMAMGIGIWSISALRLAFYFRDAKEVAWGKIGSAFVMAVAICAMHCGITGECRPFAKQTGQSSSSKM
jgi:NO-binding membrane sensor protein with MHYT domain